MSDIVRVVRVLEYEGPREWIEHTPHKGAVPAQGVYVVNENTRILSGILGNAWAVSKEVKDHE